MNRRIRTMLVVPFAMTMLASGVDAKEFLVGVEMPLSGALARAGKSNLEGITVGVEVFNRNNPKHTVKLITIDDESSPAKAIAAVEKLASQGVLAINGGYGSNLAGPASTAADKAGMAYLTVGGTATSLTERGLKTFFRPNNTAGYANGMVGAVADMGVKSVSLVYSTKEATNEIAQLVGKGLRAKKIKVSMHPFDPSVTDFKPIINKIKVQDRPEVIAMVGYENDHLGILRAARVMKPEVRAIIGPYSTTTSKLASEFPDVVANVLGFVMLSHPVDPKNREAKDYQDTFRKLYKRDGDDSAAQWGYVQTLIMCEAIKRADEKKSLTRGAVVAELRKTNRDSMLGRIRFNEVGDNPAFITRVGQVQNGRIPVVWPKEYAVGKAHYPAVPW
jgi:branched-chain amino acid transport system substrate-binding protein